MRTAALVLAAAGVALAQVPEKRVVGYYTSWSIYARNYLANQIPAAQVTHINYAFANLVGGVIALGDHYADVDRFYPGDCWAPGCRRGNFHQLEIHKQNNPGLRTLISIGGWTWSGGFSDAVLTPASRATFAASIVNFVDQYYFDGADIDWEYPVSGGLPSNPTRPQDKQNYTLFLQELRAQFTARSVTTGKQYLLTIAAPANPAIIDNLEVALIWPLLDWINVMTYDFHGPWGDPVTGMNAPMFGDPVDPMPEPARSQFNTTRAIDNYLALGVPRSKLQIGVPFYGRGFGGVTAGPNFGLYRSYSGPSWPGTWENGVYDWTHLRNSFVNLNGYTAHWMDLQRVPWLYSPTASTFISYDDPRSVSEKVWFVQAADLGGAMFWEFSCDRQNDLLGPMHTWLRQRPALRTPVRSLSLAQPVPVSLQLVGGSARANRPYILFGTFSDSWPGVVAVPGSPVLPLNPDWLVSVFTSPVPPLLQQTIGVLDGAGSATAVLDLSMLAPLPAVLLGVRLSMTAWVFDSPAGASGQPTNVAHFVFVP
ncbi:MAG: glycoside hydrolase family 18 protein [Alphaproteobacteria bacterium]|nr:glycoside hydrolase family 18 protein [Alphaproteobacteria bacterium]